MLPKVNWVCLCLGSNSGIRGRTISESLTYKLHVTTTLYFILLLLYAVSPLLLLSVANTIMFFSYEHFLVDLFRSLHVIFPKIVIG